MKNKKINYWKELLYIIISAMLSLLAAYIFLNLKHKDLYVPFDYSGDALGALTAAQNFITGNGILLYPNMGAPGSVSISNAPGALNIHIFCMWILSFFIKNVGLLVNVFYLFTFITISMTATFSLRLLKINPNLSILGGILYSLLPYHFGRGIGHLFLSTYSIVPLACVLILWIMNGQIIFRSRKNHNKIGFNKLTYIFPKKTILSIIISILIGTLNPYYVLFSGLCILFAIVWNFIEEKNIRKTISASIILLTFSITVICLLTPYIINLLKGIDSGLSNTRAHRDVEVYGLKLLQLILPTYGHRLNFFAKIRSFYEHNISLYFHESFISSLGLFMSSGLIISFFIVMKRKNINNIYLHASAILNVFMILLGSIGGISSLLIFFISSARTYNRLCVFIAFYSLFIIIYYFEELLQKIKFQSITFLLIIIIGIFASLDLVGNKWPFNINQPIEKYYSDKEFINRIEDITPANSMIFQLPYVPSTHHSSFRNIGVYEQYTPFVHSNSLKWSYKVQINSTAEKWQKTVASSTINDLLKYLAMVGFSGIYIDSYGYTNEDFIELQNTIKSITNVDSIVSENGRLEYFYLGEYLTNLKNSFSEKEKMIYSNWDNVIYSQIVNFNTIYNANNLFEREMLTFGWSGLEEWGIWSEGNTVRLNFSLIDKVDFILFMNIITFPDPIYFSIDINELNYDNYVIHERHKRTRLAIPIKKEFLIDDGDGIYPVTIQFNINNPEKPEGVDSRLLGIGLFNFEITKD